MLQRLSEALPVVVKCHTYVEKLLSDQGRH